MKDLNTETSVPRGTCAIDSKLFRNKPQNQNPADICLCNSKNGKNRTMCETCWKLAITTQGVHQKYSILKLWILGTKEY